MQFIEGQYDNPFTVGWFSFPSLYYWLQSVGIRLLGQTTAGLRLMSAVAGAATVVAIYGWGRVMFNRLMGGIAAAFLLVAHFHIQFSRIGLNNIWDGLFLVIALAALWYGWKTGWRGAFIICGLATGLGQYFYVSMRILPVLLLLWVGAAAYFRAPTLRRRWPDLLLTGFIALTVFLPLLLYFADNPNEFNAPMQRVTLFDGWIEGEQLRTGETPMRIIVRQMVSTGLGITHTPLRHWYNPGTPLLLPASAALFLLGLLWSLVAFDLRYLLLWLPLLAHVFLGGFSQDAPASQRFVFVMPVVIMFVALPVARMVSLGRRRGCNHVVGCRASWPRFCFGSCSPIYTSTSFGFTKTATFWAVSTPNSLPVSPIICAISPCKDSRSTSLGFPVWGMPACLPSLIWLPICAG